MTMAHQLGTQGRPQVVQGNFQGGQPTFVAQARPGFPGAAQRQMAPHIQAVLQQHASPGQTAQQHPGPQPPAAQPNRIGNAFQVPSTVNLSRPGQGRPLPEAVRQKMESVFNTDFSDVRIHVGAQAQSIGAVAFTMGSQIHFAPGQYNPYTSHGQRLLGHELTHVMQQRSGRVRNPFGHGVAVVQDPGMEAEAERMGIQAAAHQMPVEAKREQPGMAVQQKPAPAPGGRPLAPHVQAAVAQPRTAPPQAQARPLTTAGKPEVIQGRFPGGFAQIVRFHQQAGTIQPKTTGSAVQLSAVPLPPVGGGQALPVLVQRKMETLFGTTFADVRIHEGPEVRSIGAQAFTRGSHIYFAPGQYNPTTTQGQQLLGRELAHVVQQRAGRVRNPFGSGVAVVQDPGLEAEAERMSMQAAAHRAPVQATPQTPGAVKQRQNPAPGGRSQAPHVQAVVLQPRPPYTKHKTKPKQTGGKPEVVQEAGWIEWLSGKKVWGRFTRYKKTAAVVILAGFAAWPEVIWRLHIRQAIPVIMKSKRKEFCTEEEISLAWKDIAGFERGKRWYEELQATEDLSKWTLRDLSKRIKESKLKVVGNPARVAVQGDPLSKMGKWATDEIEYTRIKTISVGTELMRLAIQHRSWVIAKVRMEIDRQELAKRVIGKMIEGCLTTDREREAARYWEEARTRYYSDY